MRISNQSDLVYIRRRDTKYRNFLSENDERRTRSPRFRHTRKRGITLWLYEDMFNEKQKLCVSVFHQVRTLLHQSQSYAAKMPFYAAKVPFYAQSYAAKMPFYAAKVPFYAARMQVGISPAAGSVVSNPGRKKAVLSVFSDDSDVRSRCMMSRSCLCIRCFTLPILISLFLPSRLHAILIDCMSACYCET